MKPGLIVAIWVIAGLPLCAEAQQPDAAKAQAAAQRVVKMIISDKTKSQIYCDIVKLGERIEETDPTDTKKTDELYQHVDELATKLGSEYIALMNGLQDKQIVCEVATSSLTAIAIRGSLLVAAESLGLWRVSSRGNLGRASRCGGSLMTRDEARRIVANIAKLPGAVDPNARNLRPNRQSTY